METKSMIGLIIGFLVGAIILASFVPIFVNVQNTSGEGITLTNDSPVVLREVEVGDVLIVTRSTVDGVTNDVWTLNGEPVIGPTGSADRWNVGIMSDGVYLQVNAPANSAIGVRYDMTATTPNATYLSGGGGTASYTFTFNEDTIVLTSGENTLGTYGYTWAYVMCPYGEGEYCAPIAGGVGIVKDSNQVILCGAYTSGDLDTMYYYKDGQTYVSNTAYTMTANITTAVHTGTTDIYDATVSVTISDGVDSESFTPYRILVPYEVTGHATKGVMFDLFGLLPLIAGVGLLMSAVVYFLRRY